MKGWRRGLAVVASIAAVAVAWIFGTRRQQRQRHRHRGRAAADPGYAARDAEVIETGYDGRERYRLKASVIRQQTESGVIDLEQLEMNYHRRRSGGRRRTDADAAKSGTSPRTTDRCAPKATTWS